MLEITQKTPVTPKRVVIIGSGGFVGGTLARFLANKNVPVKALTRADADLSSPYSVDALKHILEDGDVVVNAAAIAPCKDLNQLNANILIIQHAQEALKDKKIAHLVNISSDAVYGDLDKPITEDAPLAPGSFHGIMHLMRETAINIQGGFPITHVRPTLIYGSEDPQNGYGPNRFMRQASKGEDIPLFGKGEEKRDHIYINDLVELLWRIIAHRAIGSVNAVTGKTHSFHDLAELSVKLNQSQSNIHYLKRNGPMPHNGFRAFDMKAITEAFPDFKFTPIEDGLSRVKKDMKETA